MSFYNHPFEFSRHNAFRAAHLYSTMPKYWESYRQQYSRLSKYRKPTGTASGNALAIRHLQRQINKQKPELQHTVVNNVTTIPEDVFNLWNISPSQNLADTVDRNERILGDSWVNKSLELRFQTASNRGFYGDLRVVVYIPKKADTTWVSGDFTSYVDPNFATVLHDEVIKPSWTADQSSDNGPHYTFFRKIWLGNRVSTYIGSTPEKTAVKVAVLSTGRKASGAGSVYVGCMHRLTYTNK